MTHSDFFSFRISETSDREFETFYKKLSSLFECLNLITNKKNKSRDSFFEEKPFRVVCASECREKIISDAESFCRLVLYFSAERQMKKR